LDLLFAEDKQATDLSLPVPDTAIIFILKPSDPDKACDQE